MAQALGNCILSAVIEPGYSMDSQIKTGWILFVVAVVTAWIYLPATFLYVGVIGLMIKKVRDEIDSVKFERASLLLMVASMGFILNLLVAGALGRYSY